MDGAAWTATGRSLRGNKDRQPFRLNAKTEVLIHKELDSASNADRQIGRAGIRSTGYNRRPDATHNERPDPRRPMYRSVLLVEVTMKLVQGQTGLGRDNACTLDLGERVFPRPPELSDVVIMDSQTKAESVGRTAIDHVSRVCPLHAWLNVEAHVASISAERRDVKAARIYQTMLLTGQQRSDGE